MSTKKRKNTEKILTADETVTYSFVELSFPYEDKKKSTELGDNKASTAIQRVSAVFMGSARNGFPPE